MRVCFVSIEMFGVKKIGGFGRATRIIGRELVNRGVDVCAVVPRPRGVDAEDLNLDGIRMMSYPVSSIKDATEALREVDADIYHSQDTSLTTYLAMKAKPDSGHVVTFRDPLDLKDRFTELQYALRGRVSMKSKFGAFMYSNYIDNPLVRSAVYRSDALYCAAKCLIPKVEKKYRFLRETPSFMPTPVLIPDEKLLVKADRPTVSFVARFDQRKRPEMFFELARANPDVRFIAVGGSHDPTRDRELRETYSDIPNLEMTGVINQFESDRLFKILAESWIMVNTAAREGLPNAFIEALAYKCPVLSFSDPDEFASKFGYHATQDDLQQGLQEGLTHLLENDRWRERGERGFDYVKKVFSLENSIAMHLEQYEQVMDKHNLVDRVGYAA